MAEVSMLDGRFVVPHVAKTSTSLLLRSHSGRLITISMRCLDFDRFGDDVTAQILCSHKVVCLSSGSQTCGETVRYQEYPPGIAISQQKISSFE